MFRGRMSNTKTNETIRRVCSVILFLFGGLTLFMSSAVIFDWLGIRGQQGHYVPFIVWANFICSWCYLSSVYGFIKNENWTLYLLISALIILIIAFIVLQFHIDHDGAYEPKTVKAMVFRMSLTLIMSIVAFFSIHRKAVKNQ